MPTQSKWQSLPTEAINPVSLGVDKADIRFVVPREKRVKIGDALHLQPDPRQTHFFGADGKAVRA